jgi:tetratricopeptide (TPR) repeat protein
MAYGKALEYDAKWSLSADVYETIVLHTDPVDDADLAVAAHLQLAFSLRSLGELDAAASAYSQAASIAHAAHDLIGVLRGHLGDARIVALRGNLPRADAMLDTAIKHAAENGLDDVRSSALIDRAWVAGTGQHYDRVVCYSYEALELSKSSRQRERILNNIANAFRYLGMRDAARDAFLVISLTGQEQYMKWMAELNLMELAAEEGSELQFDKFRRDLESADFTPELRVTYLLHVGRGYHALGNAQTGISYLERAIELAAKHQMNHVIFEAEAALAAAKKDKWTARSAATEWTPEVQNVAGVIRRMATAGWGP